jgi:hypothetical protein
MAMAALISANIAAQAAAQESEYSNDLYMTNDELGIQDIIRTTMGQEILKQSSKPTPSKNWWQKFINGLTISGTGRHKGKARW